jgi:hypothetical protein
MIPSSLAYVKQPSTGYGPHSDEPSLRSLTTKRATADGREGQSSKLRVWTGKIITKFRTKVGCYQNIRHTGHDENKNYLTKLCALY